MASKRRVWNVGLTVAKWGFEALETVGFDWDWWIYARGSLILMVQLWALLILAALKLRWDD